MGNFFAIKTNGLSKRRQSLYVLGLYCAVVITVLMPIKALSEDSPTHLLSDNTAVQPNQSLPPDEPPFLDDELKALPPGVELRPDGTMVKDGVVVGAAAIDSPQRRKMRRVQQFSSQWAPSTFYLDDWRMYAPYKLSDIVIFLPDKIRLTGLATASSSDELIYTLAAPDNSRLVERRLDEYRVGEERFILDTDALGASDLWFHQPISLSPNKRWVLVAVSVGRTALFAKKQTETLSEIADKSDIWLLDMTTRVAPHRIASETRLLSSSWSADGLHAVIELMREGAEAEEAGLYLLDASTQQINRIAATVGPAWWSPAGDRVLIRPRGESAGVLINYDPATGTIERQTEAIPNDRADELVWSEDGSRWARCTLVNNKWQLWLGDTNGQAKSATTLLGQPSMLGFSARAELLAYVAADASLHFAVCSLNESNYQRLMDAIPPALRAHDESRPGLQKGFTDMFGLATNISPIKVVNTPRMFAWGETLDGPCLVYAETSEKEQRLRIFRFATQSLEDLGLDPRQDLQPQIVRQYLDNSATYFAHALSSYAQDHEGKLPPYAGGESLETALSSYLLDPHMLRSMFDAERVCARLLVPGVNLEDFVGADASRRVVAEIRDGGVAYAIVANPRGGYYLGEDSGIAEPLSVELMPEELPDEVTQ